MALQRTDRSGYKGGALHEAMQQTPHDFFAIFDVDYVPPVDFLRRCMRVFVAEPKAAFVQARFDFLNPHENALTEMQMVTLDAHLGIEQATRYWAGIRCRSTAPAASGSAPRSMPAAAGRATRSPRTSTSPIAAGSRAGARCS